MDYRYLDWGIDGGNDVCILSGPSIQVTQPRQGSTAGFPGMTYIPYFYCYTVTVVPGGTSWFSAKSLGRASGYVLDPPKSWIMSPIDQFQ